MVSVRSELDEVVIMVHGTFAGDEARQDDGDRWWQRGSEVWAWFERHLPEGTSLPDSSLKLFHWSGENSQVDRLEASNRLLALLLTLERQGRGYHLVGHSHGGSIIWEALISAEVTRSRGIVDPALRQALNDRDVLVGEPPIIPLRSDEFAPGWVKYKTRFIPRSAEFAAVKPFIRLSGLRSWTTVGTPFLHHLPKSRLFVRGWPEHDFSLSSSVRRSRRAYIANELLDLVVLAPFFALPLALIFPETLRRTVGNAPAGALGIAALICWAVAFVVASNRNYANSLICRERAAHHAMDRFSGRWLALWATEDEAITGLDWLAEAPATESRGAMRTPSQDRPERSLHEMVDTGFADKLLRLRGPIGGVRLIPRVQLLAPMRIANPVIWAYNKLLAPSVGRVVLKTVIRRVQGADLPHASLIHSSPWPLPLSGVCPGLPTDVEDDIHAHASRDAGNLGSIARKLLMTAALEGVPAARHAIQDHTDRGSPLVHTSYFDHESVRRLINLHIHRSSAKVGVVAPADELSEWLAANSNDVRERLNHFAMTTRG